MSFAQAYETAKDKGEAVAPRWSGEPMHVGVRWFEEVQSMDTLAEIAKYPGSVLAVHGVDDSTLPPESAEQIVKTSPNSASRTHMVENCAHTFNAFTEDTATMDGMIAVTGEYFLKHLG
ncbi:alpha/beta fold hydrolase [Oscillibacter sp.]|uniref:alpha/beta fold hydrolase n=2 Tax=Oscillibacter TaxID=459786 RepID=UPI00216E3584|nr:alpha/beta hydrolase [Oscillibacter sp.]MCI9115047.1 alpha/beta hydrolase [Oscillibacter sp.]